MKHMKLFGILLLFAIGVIALNAATMIHDFQFNNNLSDGLSPSGSMTVYNSPATQGYSTGGYNSASAWYWTKDTTPGAGLCMHTSIATATSYSLGIRFKVNSIKSGYGKVVSFKGHQSNHSFTSDNGLYFTSGQICIYVAGAVTETWTISANTLYDLILVKSGTSVVIYGGTTGSTLTSRLTYTDSGNNFTSENVFGIFYDDTATNTEYFTGGTIDAVRVWDGVLSSGQMSQDLLSSYHYRSKASGNWNSASTWEMSVDNTNWTDADIPPGISAQTTTIRNGHTVTLTDAAACNNLVLDGGSINLASNPLTINGTLTESSGSISGGTPQVDGYSSPTAQFVSFPPTGNLISGFSASSTTNPALWPSNIMRYWQITGTYTGSKTVTFYWNAADDNNFDWAGSGMNPILYKGSSSVAVNGFDVSSNPRWLTAFINESMSKDVYTITSDELTLPIELSSFTAIVNSQHFVELNWTTQSETNVAGFYVYRNSNSELGAAQIISPLIPATNTSSQSSYTYVDQELGSGVWYYWLQNMDVNGHFSFHGPVIANVNPLDDPGMPDIQFRTGIQSIFPNPFSNRARISYALESKAKVEIEIYNVKGALVRTSVLGEKNSGTHIMEWDGKDQNGNDCPTGVYFVKMTANAQNYLAKLVLIK